LSSSSTREWESPSTLLEELEWVATASMVCEWILLLSSMWIIWVFSIVVSLTQFWLSADPMIE